VESLGQYGHLILLFELPLQSLIKLSFEITCPQFIIIGGFVGVLASLLTGHAKTLWKC
jgi:hypothetical protein